MKVSLKHVRRLYVIQDRNNMLLQNKEKKDKMETGMKDLRQLHNTLQSNTISAQLRYITPSANA